MDRVNQPLVISMLSIYEKNITKIGKNNRFLW